ncbi:MAG TPA: hypothetical protein VJH03_16390 [Blastocatellia bacterium]|nr:hypothetical protein [Blastocatellia bacterium]
MTTIEARIPEPVLKQARELAERENIPLEQIISLAVTQAVGIWSNESYLAIRGARATKEKFIDALKQVPDANSPEYDHLPDGYTPPSL